MKLLLTVLMATAITASAADTNKVVAKAATAPAQASTSWFEKVSVAPVGAIKTEHLDGPSQWGAGLDVGAAVNPFVSIHVVNLSFEGPGKEKDGHDAWGGLLVDETAVQVDSKISRFSNETFSLHLVGGAQTDWNDNNWGVNVGPRLALDFNKNFGISAGYSIRTWFKGETKVDSLATAQLNVSF
jgi:hypothetical protein